MSHASSFLMAAFSMPAFAGDANQSRELLGLLLHENFNKQDASGIAACTQAAAWPENRCLVPANSFAEYAPEPNPETKKKDVVWFALNEDRPVSKRADRAYRAGRCTHWIKVKNRKHPAYRRVQDRF